MSRDLPPETEVSLDRIADALERIADAIESRRTSAQAAAAEVARLIATPNR